MFNKAVRLPRLKFECPENLKKTHTQTVLVFICKQNKRNFSFSHCVVIFGKKIEKEQF